MDLQNKENNINIIEENKENSKDNNGINWKVNLAVLWLAVILCASSYTMCVPFLPVFLWKEMGLSQDEVGLWTGLTFATTFFWSAVMAPCWGALADKVGQKRMALRAGIGLGLTYFLTAISQNVYQLFVVRTLTGMVAGFVPACMSLASQTLPEHRMGWGMGIMQSALFSGTIVGPLLGGYLSSWFGMRMTFYLAGTWLITGAVLIFFFVKDLPFAKEKHKLSFSALFDFKDAFKEKEIFYIMGMIFAMQSVVMLVQPLITMYVGELRGVMDDDTIKQSGWIFSLAGLAGIIAATFWGKRGQNYGYIKIFSLAVFCAGFTNLFQMFIQNVWQFALIQFIYGLFLAGGTPNVNAYASTVTDKQMRGRVFGLMAAANQFGGVAGPLAGSLLGSFMPTKYVLVTAGVILICVASYSYISRVKNENSTT